MLLHSQEIQIGTPMVTFNLPGVDGQYYSNDSCSNARGVVLVVTCNHCPYAKASWPILIELAQHFRNDGIQFIAINPNDDITYPDDSFDAMKQKALELAIPFPYLRDENQEIAKHLNAVCTPDIYLYDQQQRLYYHGRINDNWKEPQHVQEENLKDAIESLINGNPPPLSQPASMGCSIKWK